MELNSKSTILIVDDDIVYLGFLVKLLKGPHTLYVAKRGQDAINMAMKTTPDLVLLDVNLPDMTGFEVLSTLRHIKETEGVTAIFVTGSDDQEGKTRALQLGAVDYIHKSTDANTIKARVESQIERK